MKTGFPYVLALFLIALGVALPQAARGDEPAVVGAWDCTSDTPDGGQFKFVLTVKHEDGKFSATGGTDDGEFPVSDFTVDGDEVSFKATIDDQDYSVKAKVSGATLEGKWNGGDASGSIKGSKHA